jgi:hypothetical protein
MLVAVSYPRVHVEEIRFKQLTGQDRLHANVAEGD